MTATTSSAPFTPPLCHSATPPLSPSPSPLTILERTLASSDQFHESAEAAGLTPAALAAFLSSPESQDHLAFTAEFLDLRDRYQFALKRARILAHLDKALATAKDNTELLRTAALMTRILYHRPPRLDASPSSTSGGGGGGVAPRPEGAVPSRVAPAAPHLRPDAPMSTATAAPRPFAPPPPIDPYYPDPARPMPLPTVTAPTPPPRTAAASEPASAPTSLPEVAPSPSRGGEGVRAADGAGSAEPRRDQPSTAHPTPVAHQPPPHVGSPVLADAAASPRAAPPFT